MAHIIVNYKAQSAHAFALYRLLQVGSGGDPIDALLYNLQTAFSSIEFALGSVFRLEYHCIFIAMIAVLGASGFFVAEQLNAKRDDKGGTPKVQPSKSKVASIETINIPHDKRASFRSSSALC